MGSVIVRREEISKSREGAIKKRSWRGHPKKMPIDVTPEEAYYRTLTHVCQNCGQCNTQFRYFNNRYRTPDSRASSFDQPRYRCISPCNYEFTYRSEGQSINKRKKRCKIVEPIAHAANNVSSIMGSPSDHHQESVASFSPWAEFMTGVHNFDIKLGSQLVSYVRSLF